MKTLPSKDVVIVGAGWTGLLMAKELGSRTSLSIVVLERGPMRKLADYTADMDELDYLIRQRLMQNASQETVTLRRDKQERALPIRRFGGFLPGSGIGGSGEIWASIFPRLLPDCFELHSKITEKYGVKKLPEDHSLQDWGVTYDELEPFYARAEKELGVSGKAGNLKGEKVEGGNIFEGWRSDEYPMPPVKAPYQSDLFGAAAKSLGYHPFPTPVAITSRPYTNPDGVSRAACSCCGYCQGVGCMIGAKAQPSNVLLPVVQKQKGVSIITGASVRRVIHDEAGHNGKARGITYVDVSGEEVFQPADIVILAAWTLSNNHLLMLSGIQDRYNPGTGKGLLGKNLTHQLHFTAAEGFLERPLNRFMGFGGNGMRIGDLEGNVLDQSNLPFIRGGMLHVQSAASQPIATFGAVPQSIKSKWGAKWKEASIEYYDRTGIVGFEGEHIPYKGNYFDLDPTYIDHVGDPLLRLTINWHVNERNVVEYMTQRGVEVMRGMGGKQINAFRGYGDYDVTRYQSTHIQGGTIMSSSPDKGVVNTYLQHWQIPNLFILGASTFPNQGTANPTSTILALTYRTADVIVDRYLKTPASLT